MSQRTDDKVEYYDRPPVRRKRRKKTPWEKFKEAYLPLLLVLVGIIAIVALIVGIVKLVARPKKPDGDTLPSEPSGNQTQPLESQNTALLTRAAALAAQYDYDGALALLATASGSDEQVTQAITQYTTARENAAVWPDVGKISLISFQPLIADPSRAFDGDENADYYARNSLTVSEFNAILNQLYSKGYVLVSMEDIATPDGDGKYKAGQILLPAGKTPLILSQVPVHYSVEQSSDGFARRLLVGEDGNIACEYIDADGNRVTGAYDLVSCLEAFLLQHPDFSYRGARAILGISGDKDPLGYDITDATEQTSAKAVAQCLRDTGYEFASFTYGGIGYGEATDEEVANDVKQWEQTVEPVLGATSILFYANGSDLTEYSGAKYQTLYDAGFRYFCTLEATVPGWVHIEDNYVRQSRLTINGTRLTENADLLSDLFDTTQVISPDRPN